MICPRCGVEMILGQAIDPKRDERAIYFLPQYPLSVEQMDIIDCYKCPMCGHSETLDSNK